MKVKKNSIKKIILFTFLFFFVFTYTEFVYNNEKITDARNYYSFYQMISTSSFSQFMVESYLASGKFEALFYFFFFLYSLFSPESNFFYFTLFTYTIIFSVTLVFLSFYTTVFISKAKQGYILLFSFCMICLWFPSYLNMTWLWRTDFAYAISLLSFLFYIRKKISIFIILLLLATLAHYSSIIVVLILSFFYSFSKHFNRLSFGMKILITLFISIISSLFYKEIKGSFTSGDGNWESEYYLGNLILVYFLAGLIIVSTNFYFTRKSFDKNTSPFIISSILFSLLTFVIASNSNGNHQDITRVMHVTFLLYCFLIPLLYDKSSFFQRAIILIYILSGCFPTIYIWFNFFNSH